MDLRKIRIETVLYSLIFILAFFLRTFDLGKPPLSDIEASWALQAFQIARPDASTALVIGPQPSYVFLTGLSFALFEPNNFLARFWPACFGSLLVLTPFFFRRWLGQIPALLMAAGLALDPGITAISRQAGAPTLAVCLSLLALGLWLSQKSLLSGVFAGLAFLSGPSIFIGILTGGFSWLIGRRLAASEFPLKWEGSNSKHARRFVLACGATLLLAGALFFRYPQGLSALADTITGFIGGFALAPGVTAGQILAASILYQPFAWLFALIGVGRWLFQRIYSVDKASNTVLFPILGAIFSILIICLYPARAAGDLVWFHVFLWAIAARELSTWLVKSEAPVISAVQSALFALMFAMLWNILLSNYQVSPTSGLSWNAIRALVITGIIGLGGLTSILIAYGWSWAVSRTGLVFGAMITSMIYATFVIWSASQIRPNSPVELWSPRQTTADTQFFSKTVQDLSQWNSGMSGLVEIVSTVDRPSLRWILRDFSQTRFVVAIPGGESPAIIITPMQQEQPVVETAYRGQDFQWTLSQGWQGALPEDLISWLTMRRAPVSQETLILWARTDLFPGGASMIPDIPSE